MKKRFSLAVKQCNTIFIFLYWILYVFHLFVYFFLSFCLFLHVDFWNVFTILQCTHIWLSLSPSLPLYPSHHLSPYRSLSVCVCSDTCRDLWPGHLTIDIHGCTRIWFLLPIHISLFDKMFTALKANRPILIRSVWLTMIIWPNLRVCSSQNYEMPLMLTYPTIQTVQKDAKKPFRWVTFT